MGKDRKNYFLLLVVVLAVSSLIVESAYAQTIPKPSVPEFTMKFIDRSYDVPMTSSIDPYTGQNITNPGYHVQNNTLDLTIKNQPFVSTNIDGWNTSFYYNVRIKGHFSENWITLHDPTVNPLLANENSEDTVITFQLTYVSSEAGYSLGPDAYSSILSGLHSNAQIDFQVQALIGYVHRISNITGGNQPPFEMFPWVFDGQTSDWSNTQTITIPETSTSTSPTPNPTPTPSIPEFSWLMILPLFIFTLSIGVIVRLRKTRRITQH